MVFDFKLLIFRIIKLTVSWGVDKLASSYIIVLYVDPPKVFEWWISPVFDCCGIYSDSIRDF